MKFLMVLLLAAMVAAGTLLVGWWTVPVIAAAYALLRRSAVAPREAMVGALLGWTLLLVRQMQQPSFTTLLDRLGGIFPLPGIGVAGLALLLAVLLAWSAARVTIGVFGVSDRARS